MMTLQTHHFLKTSKCIVSFASIKVFKQAASKPFILNFINQCLQEYQNEVGKMLSLLLKNFAHGVVVQKGAVFVFEPKKKRKKVEKLEKVLIINLAEELSVELVNYGIQISDKKYSSTVSRNVVLNKSFDLLCDDELAYIRKWRKPKQDYPC